MDELAELTSALADLDKKRVDNLVGSKLEGGMAPIMIINELNAGLGVVGDRFTAGEYFLSELIYSSHIMKGIMEKLAPRLGNVAPGKSAGTVVIGTVKGDIHDIGKNIVVTLLRGAGFKVVDLGVDVAVETFVQSVAETDARVLGLSALLNFTIPEMKRVVDALVSAKVREQVRVIIGGAPADEQVREFTGADFYATDAPSGVKICRQVYNSD